MSDYQMKVLVLGGTGAMGMDLVGRLADRGWAVTITSRSERTDGPGIHYVKGNAHDMAFLGSLLERHWDCIVDFMAYGTTEFQNRAGELLSAADQYIFISSARVYAKSDGPITEESPRLLDVCGDKEYIATDEYALSKARQENILISSAPEKNYTIVRPSLTYNSNRLQFALGEKEEWLYRACHGKSVVFPEDMTEIRTTMTWGKDVAEAIALLVRNPKAAGQTIHIVGEDSHTWQEILEIYQTVLKERLRCEAKVKKIENALTAAEQLGRLYQIKYARAISREFDNSKLRGIIGGMNFTPAEDGLRKCLNHFIDSGMQFGRIDARTHAYYDRLCGEYTGLGEMSGGKQKIRYLLERYTPYRSLRT